MIKANARLIVDFNSKWLDSKREWANLRKEGCGDFSVLLGNEMLRTDQSEIVIGNIHMCDTHLVKFCLCAPRTFLLDSSMQTLRTSFSLILADIRKTHTLHFSREQYPCNLHTIACASEGKHFLHLHKVPWAKGLEIVKRIHKGLTLCFHTVIYSCSAILCNATQ